MLWCELHSNTRLRSFYGKWIEALFSYNIDVWDEYIRSTTSSGSATSSNSSRLPKVCHAVNWYVLKHDAHACYVIYLQGVANSIAVKKATYLQYIRLLRLAADAGYINTVT